MKRTLAILIPILLPFVIYWIYLLLARRRARLAGEGRLPGWEQAPWTWIITASAVLLAASLITYRVTSGVEPGAIVEPPRIELDERQRQLPVQ